jgi:ubiquinone/menaquinone biosynthesis C-methylase UbiE
MSVSHDDRRFDPKKCGALIGTERWNRWNPPHLLSLAGLQNNSNITVVDLGCGPGFWTLPMSEIVGPYSQIIALDSSQEMLEALESRHSPINVNLTLCELPSIPLPASSVDFIWAAFVFHEVTPVSVLAAEMRRVLRPGGRLALLDWRPDGASGNGPPRHHRLSFEQVREHISSAGFKTIQPAWQDQDAYLMSAS